MKNHKQAIILFLLVIIFALSHNLYATNTAFENYKLAIKSLEQKKLDETKHYLDQIVIDDLPYSDYLSKAIYLKTLLLSAEIKSDLEIKNYILEGQNQIAIENKDKREEFKLEADNYSMAAKRDVDTLLGLTNYLLANLPPVKINFDQVPSVGQPNFNLIDKLKSGTMIQSEQLNSLKRQLTLANLNEYLDLTLGVQEFRNLFVIKAKKGDTLEKLAIRFDLPVSILISVNDHIENPNLIYPGQKIYIPQVNNSHINYPAYFYYLSTVSYEANKERKSEINKLVVSAYQLTDQKNKASIDYKSKSKELSKTIEDQKYKRQLEEQAKKIDSQSRKLEQLKKKYDQLLTKLKQIKQSSKNEETDQQPTQPEVIPEEDPNSNYDPDDDPLTY